MADGKILEARDQAVKHGLHLDVVESVNVHEDIKLGRPTRDLYIQNYIATIEKLAQVGVKVICYNFMPVFDVPPNCTKRWTTDRPRFFRKIPHRRHRSV